MSHFKAILTCASGTALATLCVQAQTNPGINPKSQIHWGAAAGCTTAGMVYSPASGACITPVASSPTGSAGALVVSGGSGNALSSASSIIQRPDGALQAAMGVFKGPKVNVTDTDFAGGADPTGATDSSAAILAAYNYAVSVRTGSIGVPILYFPRGSYKFSSFPTITSQVSLEGDGSGSTFFSPTQTSGDVIEYLNANQYAYTHIRISGITINSLGHLSAATLMEWNNTVNIDMQDVVLENTGGACLTMQGDPERSTVTNVDIDNCRVPALLGDDSNEIYFTNVHILDPGNDSSNWSWNVNANPATGQLPTSGTWYPDYHAAFTAFNSQNVHFELGSIKSTRSMGCFNS